MSSGLASIGASEPELVDRHVADELAEFVEHFASHGVPMEVRHEARRATLNTLAAALEARDNEAVDISDRMSRERQPADGQPGSRVLGRRGTVVPEDAAFTNATMMHVLDFDDTYVPALVHPTAAVLAAALAVGEAEDVRLDDLLGALAIGVQVELCVAEMLYPSHYDRGFHISGTAGAVGAAAAVAAIIGLDRAQTRHALGIAMVSGGGLIEMFGSMTKAYHLANAARSGVVSARLAQRGYTSAATSFEGRRGMFRAMSDEPASKISATLSTLSTDWRMAGTSYKRYPTGQGLHSSIECVLNLRQRVPVEMLLKVKELRVFVPVFVEQTAGRFPSGSLAASAEPNLRPATHLEAKFNLPFCMAAAWAAGEFTESQLTPEAIADEQIQTLRHRCVVQADPTVAMDQGRLEATFDDGTRELEMVEVATGSPGNPLSDDQISLKWRGAASGRIDSQAVTGVADALWTGDAVTTRALMDFLAT